MNGFISRTTGSLMLLVGATGLLAVAALLMFLRASLATSARFYLWVRSMMCLTRWQAS